MSKYQRYAEYQDSGVEWLGEIPSHWEVTRLKFLAKIKNGQDYKHVESEIGFPVMGSGGQFTFSSAYMFDKPSVLLGRKGTIDKPLYINRPFWTVDTMYYTDVHKEIDVKYFYYLALTIQFNRYSTNTALPSMTQENLNNFEFSIPKKKYEQNNIKNFLDHETAKIDSLIEKQKKLIELIKEKRQAVISYAVTKGLNPDVPMKDSGVEWLGEVPEHWSKGVMKYYARVIDCKHITAEFYDEGFPLASIGEVKEWNVNLSNAKFTSEKFYLELISGDREPKYGDILFSRNATVGEAAIVGRNLPQFAMGQDVCLIRSTSRLLSDFLLYTLNSDVIKNQLNLLMVGSTFKRINVDNIRNFILVVPTYGEQQEIVEKLNIQLDKYDNLIASTEKVVVLMQERRTALISAAVTGKIDVRHWQAPNQSELEQSA